MMESEEIIELILYGATLKRVNRTGWGIAGVECIRTESVAEHVYGATFTSILISRYLVEKGIQIDIEKVLTMAAIHDLPESIISDIPRSSGSRISSKLNDIKRILERDAIQKIFNRDNSLSNYFLDSWDEFEESSTIESKIVRGADIIDMLIYVLNLEASGVSPRILHQFFQSSQKTIISLEIDVLYEIFESLHNKHQQNAKNANIKLEG